MEAKATFRLDHGYYRQLRAEWMRHISKWRRLTLPVALVIIAVGFFLWFSRVTPPIIGFAFVLTGVIQVVQHMHHQRKWLEDRLTEKSYEHEVEIVFTDERVHIRGPQSSGYCAWSSFEKCLVTDLGLFLFPRKGINIYIPDSALTPLQAKEDIAAKIRAT